MNPTTFTTVAEFDLAPAWEEDREMARLQDEWVAKNVPEARTFKGTPQRRFLSQLGERTFSLMTGWPMRQVVGPDGGWDFDINGVLVDVKGCWTPKGRAACVVQHENFRAHYYAFAVVDRQRRVGWMIGTTDVDTLRNAGTLEWACTKEPGHCIEACHLEPVHDWMFR